MRDLGYINSHCGFLFAVCGLFWDVGFNRTIELFFFFFSLFSSKGLLETNSTRLSKTYVLKLITCIAANAT